MKNEFNNRAWDRFWIILWAIAILDDRAQEELKKKREAERKRQEAAQEEWKRFIRGSKPAPSPRPS